MDIITEIDTLQVTSSDSSFIHTELTLTNEFIKNKNWLQNQVGFENLYMVVPTRKMDAMDLPLLNFLISLFISGKEPFCAIS